MTAHTLESISQAEIDQKGSALTISFGFHPTPFGSCLIGVIDDKICHLTFVEEGENLRAIDELRTIWAGVNFKEDQIQTNKIVDSVFAENSKNSFKLLCKGTDFQLKVWQSLLKIKYGHVVSYNAIASMIDQPNAARAVGTAVGSNSIAFLIPCHRVIRATGDMGGYRWGLTRKRALLAVEIPF